MPCGSYSACISAIAAASSFCPWYAAACSSVNVIPSASAAAFTSLASKNLGSIYAATAVATSDSGLFDTNESISASEGTNPGCTSLNILAASLVLTYMVSYVELSTLFNTAVSVMPSALSASVAASALPAFLIVSTTSEFKVRASAKALPEYNVAPTPTPDIDPNNPDS